MLDLDRLIKDYKEQIARIPNYIEEIKRWHDSNRQKEYQIKWQTERMRDDKIILAALTTYRTEPCEICQSNEVWYTTPDTEGYASFCPSCGRKLPEGGCKC